MASDARRVRAPRGHEVNPDTGEVVDEHPIDFESPGPAAHSYEEHLSRAHHAPLGARARRRAEALSGEARFLCVDEEYVNKVLDRLLPGLVALLRTTLLEALCNPRSQTVAGFQEAEVLRRVLGGLVAASVGEAMAYDLGGFVGLIVYRCLREAGAEDEEVLEALRGLRGGAPFNGGIFRVAKELQDSVNKALERVLVRWASRPKGEIDLRLASEVLGTPVKRARRALQVVTKVEGLGVQITKSKIDVSSGARDRDRVLSVLGLLSRRLGVELSAPQPMVATVVVKLPFELDLERLRRFERGELQGRRVKVEGSYWTALIFRSTVNVYVNLQGNLERYRGAVGEVVPRVCRYALLTT